MIIPKFIQCVCEVHVVNTVLTWFRVCCVPNPKEIPCILWSSMCCCRCDCTSQNALAWYMTSSFHRHCLYVKLLTTGIVTTHCGDYSGPIWADLWFREVSTHQVISILVKHHCRDSYEQKTPQLWPELPQIGQAPDSSSIFHYWTFPQKHSEVTCIIKQ